MSKLNETTIKAALSAVKDDVLATDLVSSKLIQALEVDASGRVTIRLQLGYPAEGERARLQAFILKVLAPLGATDVVLEIDSKIRSYTAQPGVDAIAGVKNIIAVASGKGGVGKSTTSVNIALAIAQLGARVAILDADIYGPSQPTMLGAKDVRPEVDDANRLQPVISHGLQSMSIGYLVDQQNAMVWRGPMVSGALSQLLNDTQWDNVDYLVVDLPPGTGDIQLTMAQKIPVTGALVVTTPQDIALIDARRAVDMFKKVNIPVMGVVENMSTYVCPECNHKAPIFGEGGGERFAREFEVDLLGRLPLALQIREEADAGTPTVAKDPASAISAEYIAIARKLVARMSLRAVSHQHKFPKIVVENN